VVFHTNIAQAVLFDEHDSYHCRDEATAWLDAYEVIV
jgi:hypothetical protein